MLNRFQMVRRNVVARTLLAGSFTLGSLAVPSLLSAVDTAPKQTSGDAKPADKGAAHAAKEKKEPKKEIKSEFPLLPQPISSFGAVRDGDWVYVYSGHTGGAHQHSKKNLALSFQRIDLTSPKAWESLPVGPGLQSVSLVAHGGSIYRVGGLSALNEPGEKENLVSVTDFFRFDPTAKSWTPLEPLPVGRSSHDSIAVGSKVYVIGGWDLGSGESKWHKKPLVIDLAVKDAKWQELAEQPFERRAIAVAELNGKIYAIGGMSPKGPSNDVHVFDTASNTWAEGPTLPGGKMNGFGSSAVTVDGKLFASGMDGAMFRLSADGKSWETVAQFDHPRFFHRLVDGGNKSLLAIAGASMQEGHFDSIERVSVAKDAK